MEGVLEGFSRLYWLIYGLNLLLRKMTSEEPIINEYVMMASNVIVPRCWLLEASSEHIFDAVGHAIEIHSQVGGPNTDIYIHLAGTSTKMKCNNEIYWFKVTTLPAHFRNF